MRERGGAGTGPGRNGRHGLRRAGLASLMAAGLAVSAAACGGGSSPSAGSSGSTGSSVHQQAVQYAQCMRSHGLSNFPDPNSAGKFVLSGMNLASSQYQAAQKACEHLLPNGGNSSQQQQSKLVSKALKFAQCMRAHGVKSFPDPKQQGNGGPVTIGGKNSGINPNSPQFQSAQQACRAYLPGGSAP